MRCRTSIARDLKAPFSGECAATDLAALAPANQRFVSFMDVALCSTAGCMAPMNDKQGGAITRAVQSPVLLLENLCSTAHDFLLQYFQVIAE
jgi:hypothetical protein